MPTSPSAPFSGWTDRLVATVVAALALTVVAGWLLQSSPMVQVRGDWVPMQFNTALGFLLLGGGMLIAIRVPKAAAACGLLAALLGFFTLGSYILDIDIGLDQGIVSAFTTVNSSHPGRMAPNSAFAFCLAGASLVILSRPALAAKFSAAAVSLGLVAAAVGLLSLLAYAAGTPRVTGWRAFTAMAPTTAIAFLITGALLSRAGWRQGAVDNGAARLWPSAVGLTLLLISFNLWQALTAQALSRLEAETAQVLDSTRQMVADRVVSQLNLMERMARRWDVQHGSAGAQFWRADAEMMLEHFPYIDGVGLTDKNWIYRHAIYRGGPRKVLGTRADREALRRAAFLAAVERGEVRLTPAVELIQGGMGFVIVAPAPSGLALAGVYFSDLLRPYAGGYPDGFSFAVAEGDKEVYRSPAADAEAAHRFERTIDLALPGATWRISVWPAAAYLDGAIGPLPLLVLLFGVVTAILAWTTLRMAQLSAASNRQLSQMTHILESQVAERRRAEAEVRMLNAELEDRVRQRTQELEASNKELESFSYSVSHDLRAPLSSIAGFSKMLADSHAGSLGSEGMHYVQRIAGNVTRMGQIIDDLLDLARVSRSELAIQEIDLSMLARSILARLLEREPGRAVEHRVVPGLRVRADPSLMTIVLENLLSNALKFSASRTPAIIEVGSDIIDGRRVLFVRDNGVGYDTQYSDKLFGVFQRLHSASEFPGNGIGLATVKRVIARHRGEIWASSEPGRGAVFFFWLPD
jgi:signal transduction histidine kinase